MSVSLLATLVLTTSAAAAETPWAQPEAPTVGSDDDDTGVSLEFLEFLGEWEAGDGEWIDPTEIDDENVPPSIQIEGSSDAP